MEPQTPASLTTLFDLKVKQQVTNNTIFSNATQVFDHKLGNSRKCTLRISFHIKKLVLNISVDYFRILYEDEEHMIGGFEKTKSFTELFKNFTNYLTPEQQNGKISEFKCGFTM